MVHNVHRLKYIIEDIFVLQKLILYKQTSRAHTLLIWASKIQIAIKDYRYEIYRDEMKNLESKKIQLSNLSYYTVSEVH